MLLDVMTHADYLAARDEMEASLGEADLRRLGQGRWLAARKKLELLDLDPARETLLSLYSPCRGRPARDPTTGIRSIVLMQHLGFTSPTVWACEAGADAVIQCLIGTADVPAPSCHYDLMNRLARDDPHGELHPEGYFTRELKELRKEHQLKKGEKLVNFDEGDTETLTEKYRDDASCDAGRWSLPLETILDRVAVRPSMERYADELEELTLSGDGSSLHTHASQFGHRAVEDTAEAGGTGREGDADDDGNGGARDAASVAVAGDGGGPGEAGDGAKGHDDDAGDDDRPCTHRYTAPDADIGWDSDKGEFYLGYTFYNISCHLPRSGVDLPVFVAQRAASQHDALTCVSAMAHMLDVNPALRPDHFCHDSAADATAIFEWLRHRGITPIIDLNQRRSSEDPDKRRPVAREIKGGDGEPLERVNERGVPVCARGHEMVRNGYDRSKKCTKYRCPHAVGRVRDCPMWGVCTKSEYGRVVNVYDKTNIKMLGPVPYGSERWKEIYKARTCTERVNNRVLNDYKVQHMKCRNGPKHFVFEVMAAINIHLDAWVKTSGPGAQEEPSE